MKILFLIPSLAGGGQEKAGMILTNYLVNYHQVKVVCLEPASMLDYPYKAEVERIAIKRSNSVTGKIWVVIKRVYALRMIKRRWKPDVSIAIGPTAILINSLSFGKEQKFSSIRQSLSKLKDNRFLNKILFSISGKLVPVHNGINDELLHLYKIKNNLFAYNGYDLDIINTDLKDPIEPPLLPFFNGKVICHLGRFDAQKCNWHIVKVFDQARKRIPGLKLMMIGEVDRSHPQNALIYQFCLKYLETKGFKVKHIGAYVSEGADDFDVLMMGHQMNPHKYMAKADLFIFPSAWEGFPNALVEAMACGLPVVSADCPTGPKEILTDEHTGEIFGKLMPVFDHVFDENDFTRNDLHLQWADTICEMLEDDESLNFYKNQALKRAQDFSVEKSCKKWLDIIENKI